MIGREIYHFFQCYCLAKCLIWSHLMVFTVLQVHSSGVATWSLKELTQEFYGLTIAYEEVRLSALTTGLCSLQKIETTITAFLYIKNSVQCSTLDGTDSSTRSVIVLI